MKIGLIADSQGDVDALEYACDLLLEELGAERVCFLGGRWQDLDALFQRRREAERGRVEYTDADFLSDVASFVARREEEERGSLAHRLKKDGVEAFIKRFSRVPDKDSLQYRDPSIRRTLPDLIGDRIACLVHDKADLTRDDIEAATFLLHGCSADPAVVAIGPRFFVTPGSLTGGARHTCGMIRTADDGLEFVAFGLDGRELQRWPLQLVNRRKLSAR